MDEIAKLLERIEELAQVLREEQETSVVYAKRAVAQRKPYDRLPGVRSKLILGFDYPPEEDKGIELRVKREWKDQDTGEGLGRMWQEIRLQQLKNKQRRWEKHCETVLQGRKHQAQRKKRERESEGYYYTTLAHIEQRREVWLGRCYLCGRPGSGIDHVIPLAKGGSSWPANLRPCCWPCNNRKSAKWPYDIEAHRWEEGYYERRYG